MGAALVEDVACALHIGGPVRSQWAADSGQGRVVDDGVTSGDRLADRVRVGEVAQVLADTEPVQGGAGAAAEGGGLGTAPDELTADLRTEEPAATCDENPSRAGFL
ncbi:hypothetical protein GCM10010344_62700 [Streptomyces bluensis]|nr:hypothetical protein GCM10010344_62700 [Streptomyces bluensis]